MLWPVWDQKVDLFNHGAYKGLCGARITLSAATGMTSAGNLAYPRTSISITIHGLTTRFTRAIFMSTSCGNQVGKLDHRLMRKRTRSKTCWGMNWSVMNIPGKSVLHTGCSGHPLPAYLAGCREIRLDIDRACELTLLQALPRWAR